jgi:hypothetical protein
MRRGAASCRAVLGSCPVEAAVRAAAQVPSPRSRPGWPSAPSRRDPGEVWPPSEWSPVARMSGRRPGWSLPCPPRPVRGGDVRPAVERTSSVHASGVQASGVSGCPAGQAPVSAALPPRCPRRAGPWSGSVWWAAPACAAGRRARGPRVDVPVVRGWGGRLPASGRAGRDGSALAVPGSHEVDRSQGRRLAGVRLRRRLGPGGPTRALVQGQGAGRWRGAWDGAGAHRPRQGVLGRSLAWSRPWAWTRRW